MSRGTLCTGRFRDDVDPHMARFNASIIYDKVMWEEDIVASKAYARQSQRIGLLSGEELEEILSGLSKVEGEWRDGSFVVTETDEDIHTANERRLTEIIGPVAGKLHTGRSRNDQVATDMRLWLRNKVENIEKFLTGLIEEMAIHAETHIDLITSGFTHLQPAQPIRYSHWMLSHVAALLRDFERLNDAKKRVNVCPLGCGAIAGHAFGIDRTALSEELGFEGVTLNSIDTVCDRDFIAEFMSVASMLMVHISQLSEDIILFNWKKFISLSDAYCTGSSLMPQKKNPDALELLRGKCGRVIGNSTGFLVTLKGLPRAYNKDLQEDKEPLFDTVDTVESCLQITTGVIKSMTPNPASLKKQLSPEMLATDLAEYLVRKGIPFRETHHIAGAVVKLSEDSNVPLPSLSLDQLKGICDKFDNDAIVLLGDFEASIERKRSIGGTARAQVTEQIMRVRASLASLKAI